MFKKASKKKSKLRLAIQGASGSGKTTAALVIGTTLGKVAYVDTERGSASLYSDKFDFDVLELDRFEPEDYIKAMNAAAELGYDVVVIDSYSHEWLWCLEMASKLAANGGNSYTAWAKITPRHDALIHAILASKIHVIACMRSKTEYAMEENGKGKMVPKKIGMASVQRDNVDYEFTVVFELNQNHMAYCSKDRTTLFAGKDFEITKQTALDMKNWLESGAEADAPVPIEEQRAEAIAKIKTATDYEAVKSIYKEYPDLATDTALVDVCREAKTRLTA